MEGNLSTKVTDHLARFFVETSYGALPPEVIHEAKRCIVDGIGVALGGADHPSAEILLKYCRALGGNPEAQAWGHPDRLPVELAALVNGHQGHVLDFDDTFLPPETALHGTVPLLSPLLAIAEQRHSSGQAVLRGFALGFEAEARLALALRRKVILIPDDSIRKDEGSVAVRLKDGSRRERHIPRASGTVENPLSDEALSEKFLDLATPLIGPRSRQVLDLVWSLDRLADAAQIPLLLKA